jgi:hypothetical protein
MYRIAGRQTEQITEARNLAATQIAHLRHQ